MQNLQQHPVHATLCVPRLGPGAQRACTQFAMVLSCHNATALLQCQTPRWVTHHVAYHQHPVPTTTTPGGMQTQGGKVAQGFCKQEMQDFLRYFVHPLAEKCIQQRVDREARMQKPTLYSCDGKQVAFGEVVEHWKKQLQAAYRGLELQAWLPFPGVPKKCYQPTDTPYFLSYDNASSHSFWTDTAQSIHLPRRHLPLSLLQIIRICPKGHDIHQLVEHSIGAIKKHVATELVQATLHQEPIGTDLLWDLVQDGMLKYNAASWKANLVKLECALQIIAADKTEVVEFEYPKGRKRTFPGQAGNYAPMFVS